MADISTCSRALIFISRGYPLLCYLPLAVVYLISCTLLFCVPFLAILAVHASLRWTFLVILPRGFANPR